LIGKKQGLFMFHQWSPGNAFFLPPGAKIYNKYTHDGSPNALSRREIKCSLPVDVGHRLMNFIRDEYRVRGYQEVITPLVFNKELWETSGHWQNYKDDMFAVTGASHAHTHDAHAGEGHSCAHHAHSSLIDKEEVRARHLQSESVLLALTHSPSQVMGLKPMNCPAHCLIFSGGHYSYRDLPLRLADFGVLHRNELSGALTGAVGRPAKTPFVLSHAFFLGTYWQVSLASDGSSKTMPTSSAPRTK
jgi:threonyl-tRNA synthetase